MRDGDINATYDLKSIEFISNPYPTYRKLRENGPVNYIEEEDAYFILDYGGCAALLSDLNFGKKFQRTYEKMTGVSEQITVSYDPKNPVRDMLFLDPPDHTRLRNLVSKAFTPRSVESIRPFVRSLAERFTRNASNDRIFDIMSEYAGPIPAYTIAKMLGVPQDDMGKFKKWSDSIALSLDATRSKEEYEEARIAGENLFKYVSQLIDVKRNSPEDDLLSSLIEAEESGDKLTNQELIKMVSLLLVAGHETTTNLIGNGFLALLRNPDQMSMLKDDRTLLKNAVEEFLRYDPPVQQVARAVYSESFLSGYRISPNSKVSAVIGAANRDPEIFEDPDKLDITRKKNNHLSFSKGIHFCIGSPLARLEGEIAFDVLMDHLPDAKLFEEPIWRNNANMHGMESLKVKVI